MEPESVITVSILLGSYNGEHYIRQQLESIRDQIFTDWILYISDDGSSDGTLRIIEDFSKTFAKGKVNVFSGPKRGFAANFLSLVRKPEIRSTYYAFCDQDDIWLSDKLESAVNQLTASRSSGKYTLYGSRTVLINDKLELQGQSPLFSRLLCLKNALVQSYSGGNTMVFSHSVKLLIEKLPKEIPVVSHDWFLYILVSALDGKVIYDRIPKILYRQHSSNMVGSNLSFLAKLQRLKKICSGICQRWNLVNSTALRYYSDVILPENKKIIDLYFVATSSPIERVRNFISSGVYRQKKHETVLFLLIAGVNKLN